MNRSIAGAAFVAVFALALVAVALAPRQASALSLSLHVKPTTVSPGGAVTLSGRISPKLPKAATVAIQRSRAGSSFVTIKRISLAKGSTRYRTRWVAGTELGPVRFRAKFKTITTGSIKVTVLAQESVQIKDFAFTPQTLTVKAWTRVTWTNEDAFDHTVTAVDSLDINATPTGLFDSGFMPQGNTFRYTFTKPGTFFYECQIHFMDAAMHADVVVQ
jgi:plastocyanin